MITLVLGLLKVLKNQKGKVEALEFIEDFYMIKDLKEEEIFKQLPL